MFDEDAEHEPDPEPDPPDLGPDVPDYEDELPDVPEPPEPGEDVEVPGELLMTFWGLVVVFNVAILAIAVGLLFFLVAGDAGMGTNLLFVGGVLGAYGLYRYWTSPYRDGLPDGETASDGDEPGDGSPGAGPSSGDDGDGDSGPAGSEPPGDGGGSRNS